MMDNYKITRAKIIFFAKRPQIMLTIKPKIKSNYAKDLTELYIKM